jgi:hypothetical protein
MQPESGGIFCLISKSPSTRTYKDELPLQQDMTIIVSRDIPASRTTLIHET